MLRMLMTRRWLGILVLAAVFCVVAVALGNWQYSRHVDTVTRIERIEAHYDAEPVPLSEVLPHSDAQFSSADEWTRVRAEGVYAAEAQHLVRNRPHRSVYGYEVVVPLVLPGGGALLVDRGWVPNAETAASLPDVPPVPGGQVGLTGWLRSSEGSQGRDLPAGQLATINLPEAEQATGLDLHDAYLILESEDAGGDTPARPEPLEPPTLDQGPHLAYALQWWVTSPVGFVLAFVMLRREVHGTQPAAAGAQAERRPKKVRIWDEEDY